jgi:predicted membrane channel-forming protein YqfA (hemolysin III family)
MGVILIAGGMLLIASSFLVELTIFSDDPGLGFRQIMGIVTGSTSAGAGAVLLFGKRKEVAVMLTIVGSVLLAVGIVVSLTALLIDLAGVHTRPGFGPRQTAGLIAGVLAISGGLVVLASRKKLQKQ